MMVAEDISFDYTKPKWLPCGSHFGISAIPLRKDVIRIYRRQ